jgi:nucleotide-binding universal stress UspA family protein
MIKRILVGLGGTIYTPSAVRHAIDLCRSHDAELTGVTVVDMERLTHVGPAPIGGSGAAEELIEHRLDVTRQGVEEAVAQFEAACREAGVRHRVDRETGDPFELMTALSRFHDVMVFGLRSVFDYGLGNDVPDALDRLIGQGVRPIVAAAEHYRPIRRVLLAHSGSLESARTIKAFVRMRIWPDVDLRVITCEKHEDVARELLGQTAGYCRAHGFEVETEHLPGTPHEAILAHAGQWDADLIVLGNSVRSYLVRKIFGETVCHVIQEADRPLFLSY